MSRKSCQPKTPAMRLQDRREKCLVSCAEVSIEVFSKGQSAQLDELLFKSSRLFNSYCESLRGPNHRTERTHRISITKTDAGCSSTIYHQIDNTRHVIYTSPLFPTQAEAVVDCLNWSRANGYEKRLSYFPLPPKDDRDYPIDLERLDQSRSEALQAFQRLFTLASSKDQEAIESAILAIEKPLTRFITKLLMFRRTWTADGTRLVSKRKSKAKRQRN